MELQGKGIINHFFQTFHFETVKTKTNGFHLYLATLFPIHIYKNHGKFVEKVKVFYVKSYVNISLGLLKSALIILIKLYGISSSKVGSPIKYVLLWEQAWQTADAH